MLRFTNDDSIGGIPANATGQYRCVAQNCVGRSERNISVTVLGEFHRNDDE